MERTHLTTTVDTQLIDQARKIGVGSNDAELIDAALMALLRPHRRREIDRAYDVAYEAQPIDTPDEWGDLASFPAAASQS